MAYPDQYEFDVTTALHDDMKGGGGYPTTHSRVVLSREAFPTYAIAADTAACLAVAIHGGMAVAVNPRY